MNADEHRGVKLALEVDERRVEGVFLRCRHGISRPVAGQDMGDLIDSDQMDVVAEPPRLPCRLSTRRWNPGGELRGPPPGQ